jgi:hypothetical protein
LNLFYPGAFGVSINKEIAGLSCSRMCNSYLRKQRITALVHLEIASCASQAVSSAKCATAQREPRAGSTKLPNYKIA